MSFRKVVPLGGGNGLSTLVASLLPYNNLSITPIVTIYDNGGDTGRWTEIGYPAFGDARRVGVALARDPSIISELMDDRHGGEALFPGAVFGNDLLARLWKHFGANSECLPETLETYCHICGVDLRRDKLLPVSLDYKSTLCAEDENGKIIRGEHNIGDRENKEGRIVRAWLEPSGCIYQESYEALVSADVIVFGPGSLWTSTIPNCLVGGFSEAMENTKAKIVYVMNIMTEPGETRYYNGSEFVATMLEYIGRDKLDMIVCHTDPLPEDLLFKYFDQGADLVDVNKKALGRYSDNVATGNFAEVTSQGTIRHNRRVARVISEMVVS